MNIRANPTLSEEFAASLDWWRDAGVDCLFVDEPLQWIAPGHPEDTPAAKDLAQQTSPEPAPTRQPELDVTGWPDALSGFAPWWLSEPWIEEGRLGGRIPPRGKHAAQLMIVVPEPESDDSDRLLSGPDGRLLDAMLDAMSISADEVYFASVLPRHTPGTDWDEIQARGLGRLLAHHIALAAPQRLMFLGANILPLTGNDPPQGPANLQIFNHDEGNIPLLAARSLPAIRQRPRWKAELWRTWLDWTVGSSSR